MNVVEHARVKRALTPAPEPADPWLTIPQIAAQLHVSRMTLYRAVEGDYLRSIRVGRSIRIRTSWLEAWVEAGGSTFGEVES